MVLPVHAGPEGHPFDAGGEANGESWMPTASRSKPGNDDTLLYAGHLAA
jgi:hypothetical protein